jgi:hypothetical protein
VGAGARVVGGSVVGARVVCGSVVVGTYEMNSLIIELI